MKTYICFLFYILGIMNILTESSYAQWVRTNGAYGAAAFASKGSNLFAGTEGYGVSISNDNGNSWNVDNSCLSKSSVYALAVKDNLIFTGRK